MKSPSTLTTDIRQILENARGRIRHAINSAIVEAYRLIGRRIVEEEQQGESHAEYGKKNPGNSVCQIKPGIWQGLFLCQFA